MGKNILNIQRNSVPPSQVLTFSNVLNVVHNSGYGMRFRKPKIFLIGFNKCGTTSLHKFFRNQGLKSAHCWLGMRYLALEAVSHTDVLNVRRVFSDWQVFSDFTFLKGKHFVEPLDMYPIWRQAFPDAYFILNDRPVEDWVKSRMFHKDGDFLRRFINHSGCGSIEAANQWREKFSAHRNDVLSFFHNDKRFCHFMLGEDSITKVVNFLCNDYKLNEEFFKEHNAREAIY